MPVADRNSHGRTGRDSSNSGFTFAEVWGSCPFEVKADISIRRTKRENWSRRVRLVGRIWGLRLSPALKNSAFNRFLNLAMSQSRPRSRRELNVRRSARSTREGRTRYPGPRLPCAPESSPATEVELAGHAY